MGKYPEKVPEWMPECLQPKEKSDTAEDSGDLDVSGGNTGGGSNPSTGGGDNPATGGGDTPPEGVGWSTGVKIAMGLGAVATVATAGAGYAYSKGCSLTGGEHTGTCDSDVIKPLTGMRDTAADYGSQAVGGVQDTYQSGKKWVMDKLGGSIGTENGEEGGASVNLTVVVDGNDQDHKPNNAGDVHVVELAKTCLTDEDAETCLQRVQTKCDTVPAPVQDKCRAAITEVWKSEREAGGTQGEN